MHVCKIFILVIVLTGGGFTESFIRFIGPAPPYITPWSLASEYRRICSIVASAKRVSTIPLTVLFYSQNSGNKEIFYLPEWGGGGAISPDTIVVRLDVEPFFKRDFFQVTVHEMVHVVLMRAYRKAKIPRWFHEGLALVLSGDFSWHENLVLSRALFFSGLLNLDDIDSVNSFFEAKAQLAYAQSHFAVMFLIEKFGIEAIEEILIELEQQKGFWQALHASCGIDSAEFIRGVEMQIRQQNKFLVFIADTYLFWFFIALLFIAGYIATRIRNCYRVKEMEKLDNTNFSQ